MNDKIFVDTNLWVYLYSDDDKRATVAELVTQSVNDIILSTQVLGELFSVITRKKLQTMLEATKTDYLAERRATRNPLPTSAQTTIIT